MRGLVCDDSKAGAWPEAANLQQLAAEMQARGRASTEAVRRHFSGAWQILWIDPDAAVRELREAAQLDPKSAEAQSDLAAALLERAELKQDPLSILDAYSAADSAIALAPKLREAHFNRAVALEWLFLRTDAIEAWMAYLALDRSSPWANEARNNLAQLRKPGVDWPALKRMLDAVLATNDQRAIDEIVGRSPRHVREEVRLAMGTWARARYAGDQRADTILVRTMALAAALARTTGDSLWLDVVQPLEVGYARGERTRIDPTARGLVALENAQPYLQAGRMQIDSAEFWIGEAYRSLKLARSAAIYLAMYDSAQIPYRQHTPKGYDAALEAFRRIRTTTPARYPVPRALAARSEGLVLALRADLDSAVAAYSAAAREGDGSGDPGLELRPRVNLASLLPLLRGEREAWKQLYAAFQSAARYVDAPGEAQRLATTGAALSRKSAPRVALLFQREAVRLTDQMRSAPTMVTALARQAELLERNGEPAQARESVRQARAYTAKIKGDSARALYDADVDLVDGEVWLRVQPDSAVRALRDAVNRYRRSDNRLELVRAQVLLAQAYIASGAMDSAQRSFDRAIVETERRRSEITDYEARARFLDQARPVIDSIIQFRVDRADTIGALEFLESMRARVLLERVRGSSSTLQSTNGLVSRVQRELPLRTTVITYAVLGGELVTWVLRRDRLSMRRTRLEVPLETLVNRFFTALTNASSETEARKLAATLHHLLIGPLQAQLEPDSRLVFVPDKRLHFLPFAALLDEEKRKFLVESFEINVAPSVALYGESLARFASLATSQPPTVLAVGNPSFDTTVFSLPRLPGAEREAERVAADYPRSRLLVGSSATARMFLDAAKSADVVHFAGHGVVRPDAPLLSHLVMAPAPGAASGGQLYARDLYESSFGRTRLVILSGCQTASGELSDTEGASSLARAFFAAGVPAVIASLWAVDDEKTADFFAAFHHELKRGEDPTGALRQAQRQWLAREGDRLHNIRTWAAFELFGATSAKGPQLGRNENSTPASVQSPGGRGFTNEVIPVRP